jgi:hypothetical protein
MRSSHKKSPPQDSSNQEKVSTAKKGVEAPFLLGHSPAWETQSRLPHTRQTERF